MNRKNQIEQLSSDEQVLKRINKLNPRILCLVVYGQNVNAGTANMRGAVDITNYLKENKEYYKKWLE